MSDHLGGRTGSQFGITWGLSPPPSSPPSQLGDVQRVAGGGLVGQGRGLQPVDVAAVAQQVGFKRVAAVPLLVVQLQTAVLRGGRKRERQSVTKHR